MPTKPFPTPQKALAAAFAGAIYASRPDVLTPANATEIDHLATELAALCAQLAARARELAGNRSHKNLHRRVRKALGYTYP